MWQQIQVNKRNTYILLTIMLLLLLIIGATFGVLTSSYIYGDLDSFSYNQTDFFVNGAMIGIMVAFCVWMIMLIVSFANGKNIILQMNHAYKLPSGAHRILENVVEEMTIAAGLPKTPEIFVIDTPMPNAFATGLKPEKSAIAVTTGLLTELNRDELQGVVAHEISHIVNRDTMYMIFAGIMIGTIAIMADAGLRMMFSGSSGRRSRRSGGGYVQFVIMIFCLFLIILSPIVAQLLYFFLSQEREYLADACAAQYTRYPEGLATALAKISQSDVTIEDADKVTSAMYIINPLQLNSLSDEPSIFERFTSTHPPTKKRIEILSKMVSADFNAYNSAFAKVTGRKITILNKEDLVNSKKIDIVKNKKDELNNNNQAIIGGVLGATAVSEIVSSQTENYEKIARKRDAEDIIWKANDYIFKQCECGTKLKFPKEYEGQEIACPHCKKSIKVVV